MVYRNKVGFAIGTGRCGTLFLYQLMENEPQVASTHERNQDNEAFHRYCKWHALPVDDEGFLGTKAKEIQEDLQSHEFSFEASPYLSLSVKELYERFGAKFVLLVRRPDGVVTSFVHKGFYRRLYAVKDASLATGYQDQSPEKVHTFFARIAPRGEFIRAWNEMTQVGKVAWFWRACNERTLELLDELPPESYRIMRLEDFDYPTYRELSGFLGYEAQVRQADFDALRDSRPHAFWNKRHVDEWSDRETNDFESQVADLAERFGYEYRVTALRDEAKAEREEAIRLGHRLRKKKTVRRFWRARVATGAWLRRMASAVDGN